MPTKSEMATAVAQMTFPDLLSRKEDIKTRLEVVSIGTAPGSSKSKKTTSTTTKRSSSSNRGSGGTSASSPSPLVEDTTTSTSTSEHNGTSQQQSQQQQPQYYPLVPYDKSHKSDVHWDFVMKEMMWLAADFQSERKRHVSLAKKLAGAVHKYHKTKESRRLRELAEAEVRRRRLAAKMGRDVKGWWTKIERIIAYKQRLEADGEQRSAMNKQLVALVKQTERYGESLARMHDDTYESSSSSSSSSSHSENENEQANHSSSHHGKTQQQHRRRRRHRRRKHHHNMTIEEALAAADQQTLKSRRSRKKLSTDYARMTVEEGSELYGESTASDSTVGGSDDESYVVDSDDEIDDETTFLEAEAIETKERKQRLLLGEGRRTRTTRYADKNDDDDDDDDDDDKSFLADPEEIEKLQEESTMEINDVLERFQNEAAARDKEENTQTAKTSVTDSTDKNVTNTSTSKTVTFHDNLTAPQQRTKRNVTAMMDTAGSDADDDADASDVEDFVNHATTTHGNGTSSDDDDDDDDDDGSGEFIAEEHVLDDETTIDAEERLGREMSAEDEIKLLQRESEMSVEDLRRMYAGALGTGGTNNGDEGKIQESPTKKESATVKEVPNIATSLPADNNGGTNSSSFDSLIQADDAGDEDEFRPMTTEVDDETTIEAEERLGRDVSYEQEMELLKSEGDIPIEKLREMYAAMESANGATADSDGGNDGNGTNDLHSEDDHEDAISCSSSDQPPTNASTTSNLLTLGASADETDEDEFQPDSAASAVDDETTIEAEERLGRDMSYADEITMLKRESEMSVEELRKLYSGMSDDSGTKEKEKEENVRTDHNMKRKQTEALPSVFDEDDNLERDEFQPDVAEVVDDETTMIEEERLGQEMSPDEEIALLTKESEMPIEELHKMYQMMESDKDNAEVMDESSNEEEAEEASPKRKQIEYEESIGNKKPKLEEKNTDQDSQDEGLAALKRLQASEEKMRQTLASRPFLLSAWVKLRKYQQVGLNWLVSTQTRRLNGILADEMGLGKTLQTISLLAYLASYKGIWGPHLVIVPTSCIVNWETEFKRFAPGMKVMCYYGSAKRRKELRTGWTKTNWHHVVVTSYQLAVQDAFAFKRKKWYYMILDEAQNIKNFQSQRWQTLINFNTQRRLLLTGTPLQNNLMELWSLLHFLMPYIFRSRKEFSYWFSNPMNSIIEGNSKRSDELITRLHGIIRPFILRRLKKDVETQMPGKFEHIVKCKLSRRQMFLYEEFMARSSTRQSLKKGGNFMGMMNVLMQLRKVCNHPDLFEPRSVITPFVTEHVTLRTASCVLFGENSHSVLNTVSAQLIQPLWCGACGTPSATVSCDHDEIRVSQLSSLEPQIEVTSRRITEASTSEPLPDDNDPPGLASLLRDIWKETKNTREETARFQSKINSWRCRSSAFPYSRRLINAVRVDDPPALRSEAETLVGSRIISTPKELLEMRRTQQERADDMDDIIKKYVFCVPKAGAHRPRLDVSKFDADGAAKEKYVSSMLLKPMESILEPCRRSSARLSSFFPDKKLVQFDAGKLQAMSTLLHELKRGGHRALIFTQMSKMLDILEAFLNLNGHTYLRLDGATGVDRRQRLMDRFNGDTKIFCFILSTRSGGLGINLTGADTVIFYDSDWNPAMDAQAQDRAHRIGQTRDVHIYRLITEHTIEENIFIKAKQKRNLDILVMDEGKFDASQLHQGKRTLESDEGADNSQEIFTKTGLKDIIGYDEGVEDKQDGSHDADAAEKEKIKKEMSKEEMEKAMATLEDEDDVKAMHGAQKEADEELQEFDETIELKKDEESGAESEADGGEDGAKAKKKPRTTSPQPIVDEEKAKKTAEEEMEKEFAAWQNKVGMDTSAIEASLAPSERYGLNFKEKIDPFLSMFAINQRNRKMEAEDQMLDEVDIEEIEMIKAENERRAIEDGDLLVTTPSPADLPRQRNLFIREKSRLRSNKKRRKLTGENWSSKVDGLSQLPFWYNEDTGEAIWEKPKVLVDLEADELAHKKLWNAMPIKPLVHIMEFLLPFPERINCSSVCKQWRAAANDVSFVRHVFPVEMGVSASDERKLEHNHFRTIADALEVALPGDTIELGDGHYWVNDNFTVDFPLRFVGDEHDPSHVVIELSGTVTWHGKGGWIEGVTFRRPKISSGANPSKEILRVENGGQVDIVHSVMNNRGNEGAVILVQGLQSKTRCVDVEVKGSEGDGVVILSGGNIDLDQCAIYENGRSGLICMDSSKFKMDRSKVERNGGIGVELNGNSSGIITQCRFFYNNNGLLQKDSGSLLTECGENEYTLSSKLGSELTKPFVGFSLAPATLTMMEN